MDIFFSLAAAEDPISVSQALFAFGTLWFWMLVSFECILLFVFIDSENGIGATVSIFTFAALLHFFGDIDVVNFFVEHPIRAGVAIVSYFLIGTVCATLKWWLYVRNKIEESIGVRDRWLERHGYSWPLETDKQKSEWVTYKENESRFSPPKISDHKSDFTRWIAFWWIVMLWSVFDDLVKGICKEIYRRVSTMLQTMADNMWKRAGIDDLDD